MDDPRLVRLRQARRDLTGEVEKGLRRKRTRGEKLAQRLSLDELHREKVPGRGTGGAGNLLERIDGRDVRVA